MNDDEDIDVSAVYVLGNKKFDFDSPEASEIMLRAMRQAAREALLKHKLAGNPVPTERDGEMVWLQPDEIIIEDE
jgi:hypothetical protein